MNKNAGVSVVMSVFLVFAGLTALGLAASAAAAENGYLELPSDISEPAVVYVDPGEKPNFNHLSAEESQKLVDWLTKKGENSKEGDVMVVYREKVKDEVQIFQPTSFKGEPEVGAVGQELTDGRLTVKITGASKEPYMSFGSSGGYAHEFILPCLFENRGTSDVKVMSMTCYFFEPNGELGASFKRQATKQEGNVISIDPEPQVFKAGSKEESKFSSSGTCGKLNNFCLIVSYADGKEAMFVVYVPAELITEK
jgi:hypothetical protein